MNWYCSLWQLVATDKAETKTLQWELRKHVEDLLKKLLLYQMKTVCSLYRRSATNIARNMIKLDDWAGALQSVKDAEKQLQSDIDAFSNLEVRSLLNDHYRQATQRQTQLQDIWKAILENTQKNEEAWQDEQTNKCLADLRLTDPRHDMQRITDTKGGLFEGASNWILAHDDFRRWRDADETRLLCIKGDPGKGKTMLLATIVRELESQLNAPSTPLAYFFCQGTDENLNTAAAVLRGLLYLLCIQQPFLASYLRKQYDTSGSKLFQGANSFFALSEILKKIIEDERLQQAYLIIDALDECMVDRDRLLQFITDHALASPRVKWIVSSRNSPEIENLLVLDRPSGTRLSDHKVKLSLEVTQNAEQVRRAVEAFIDHKLSSIDALQDDPELEHRVGEEMLKKAGGTFLWVALVVIELRNPETLDLLEVLQEMPEELDDLYCRMLKRIEDFKKRKSEYCRAVLTAATLAYKPLRLAELANVSGLPKEISKRIKTVVALCGSFLTVKDGTVYLIHQSVKDYLIGKASAVVFPSGRDQVHRDIFTHSVQALSTGVLRRNIYSLPSYGTRIDEIKVPEPDPLTGIGYSCLYWARHFCETSCNFKIEDLDLIGDFLQRFFLYWLEAVALLQSMPEAIAAIRGLENALQVSQLGNFEDVFRTKFNLVIFKSSRHSLGCGSLCSLQ